MIFCSEESCSQYNNDEANYDLNSKVLSNIKKDKYTVVLFKLRSTIVESFETITLDTFSNSFDTVLVTREIYNPYCHALYQNKGVLISIGKYNIVVENNEVVNKKYGKWYYWTDCGLLRSIEIWEKGEKIREFLFLNENSS